jgi:hypothetical protein
MNNILSIIINSIFGLYLIISANILLPLFGCQLRKLLLENQWVKHLFGFFTLYFFIILTNQKLNIEPIYTFLLTIAIYILFILSTQIYLQIWIILFILLTISYLINTFENSISENFKETIKFIEYIINISIIVFIIIGFIYTFYKYKDIVQFTNLLWGNITCAV